uniref:Putative general secretion pathway protein n=1 Tax=uncultured bacterium lac193 TaxID=1447243 RepID=X2LBT5_9BACT|nr:putative general secretion pathway protein [uncultured bacterium lac193]
MYERFFGFRERPFELTSDPRFLFLSPSHQEALTHLQYGISSRKSLTVVVGDVGTGKTTLVRRTLALAENQGTHCVFLKNPNVTPEEFSAFLGRHFNCAPVGTARALSFELLEKELTHRWATGQACALIVDEAQSLSDEMFEELRLLTNMETDTAKLLPLLLVGQSELGHRLNDHKLRYLKQRIALRCLLRPLEMSETAAYIVARISAVGGQSGTVFSREAVVAIHEAAHGLPRAISVLCDNALVTAFAAGTKPVTARIVAEVCRDFDYERAASADEAEEGIDSVGEVEPAAGATGPEPQAPVADRDSVAQVFDDFQRRRFSIFGSGSGGQ